MSSGSTPPGGRGGGTGNAGGSGGGWSSFTFLERSAIVGTAAAVASLLVAVIALFGPFGSDDKDSKGGPPPPPTSSVPEVGPGTTETTSATTSAPTPADVFDPAPAPYSSGPVFVGAVSNGPFGIATRGGSSWSGDFYNADIVVTSTGVEVKNSSLYAVVPDPSFPTCWKATYSVSSLDWEQVPTGTVLCILTKDKRVGTVKFVWERDREGELAKVMVSGTIWAPKR